jgi:hypothetical protein
MLCVRRRLDLAWSLLRTFPPEMLTRIDKVELDVFVCLCACLCSVRVRDVLVTQKTLDRFYNRAAEKSAKADKEAGMLVCCVCARARVCVRCVARHILTCACTHSDPDAGAADGGKKKKKKKTVRVVWCVSCVRVVCALFVCTRPTFIDTCGTSQEAKEKGDDDDDEKPSAKDAKDTKDGKKVSGGSCVRVRVRCDHRHLPPVDQRQGSRRQEGQGD